MQRAVTTIAIIIAQKKLACHEIASTSVIQIPAALTPTPPATTIIPN